MSHFVSILTVVSGLCFPILGSAQEFGPDYRLYSDNPIQRSAHPVDMDGDGDLDLLMAGVDGSRIYWAEQMDGGIFRGLRFVAALAEPAQFQSVWGADMDGDGDQDVLITTSGPSILSGVGWFENLGGERFGSLHAVPGGLRPAGKARTADMDGDGLEDVVYCRSQIDPVWQKNLGNGQYGGVRVLVDLGTSHCTNLMVRDLNGDGVVDVIWSTREPSEAGWVPGLGNGAFGTALPVDVGGAVQVNFDLADWDGDGDPDLVYADLHGQRVLWTENLGNDFGATQPIAFGVVGPSQLAAGDMDGDGDSDLVFCGAQAVGLSWIENLGTSGWTSPEMFGAFPGWCWDFFLKDIDRDGDLDPMLLAGSLMWFENLGAGSFEDPTRIGTALNDGAPVDFDRDGDLDLLGSNLAKTEVLLGENRFGGAFSGPAEPVLSLAHQEFAALDLDLDGDVDLAVAQFDASIAELAVRFMRNDQGVFSYQGDIYQANDFNGGSFSLFVEHMDGDANPDLAVFIQQGIYGEYGWFRAGDSPSGVLNGFDSMPNASSMGVSDWNGDGRGDLTLVGADQSGRTIGVALQLTNGEFVHAQTVASYPFISEEALTAADVDSDGDRDLIVMRRASPRGVDVLLNDGTGMFPTTLSVNTPNTQHFGVSAVDVDRDGDPDIVLIGFEQTDWFENLGAGVFAGLEMLYEFPYEEREIGILPADLDGDGDQDLIKETDVGLKVQMNNARFGDVYCQPVAGNSTGQPAALQAQGSPVAMANDLTLRVGGLPQNQAGYFLVSTAAGLVPMAGGSQGSLCLGGAIGRMNRRLGEVFFSGTSGMASVPIDLTRLPIPGGSGPVQAGETRYFQAWYRDVNPGPTSNFTGGLRIVFE